MSKINFNKGKFSRFISSKGFYVAVALCLVGAGAATWLAVDRTITGIERNNNQIIESENRFSNDPVAQDVEKKDDSVPKEQDYGVTITKQRPQSEPESSSSTPESSSAPTAEPAIKSEQLPVSETSPNLVYASPISGNIINQFSNGELVKNLTLGDWRTHDGVDIAAEKGADVYCVADGVVKEVRTDPLWGVMLTVEHYDGKQSIYCGLASAVPVKAGDAVVAKQAIGKVDGVPCEISDENHIHFAMKQSGAWIDPMSIIPR